MHTFVQVVRFLNVVAFTAVGVAAVRQWIFRRDRASRWAAISFAALAPVVLAGLVVPEDPSGLFEGALQRAEVALLLLFPFLLYRFTRAFRPPALQLERFVNVMTIAMVGATFALPSFPQAGETRPWWFHLYLAGFLVHWSVLSVAVATRLWAAGRQQPGVSRRRMRMLAIAATALTSAIFLVVAADDADSVLSASAQVVAFVS